MRRIFIKFNLVLLGVVLICGCNYEGITKAGLKKKTSSTDDKFARAYFDLVRSHNDKMALSLLDPQTHVTVQESDIENIASYIDSDEITSVELIASKASQKNGKKIAALVYQYQIGESWFIATFLVEDEMNRQQILGFHVNPIPKSLQELNALTLAGKGVIHYLFITIALLVYVLTIYALVSCIKLDNKKKWLWIILLFTGIGRLSLNWTTGQIFLNPFTLNWGFPSPTGVTRSLDALYEPWVMNIMLPIGLIIFLIKRKKLLESTVPRDEKK